MPEPQFILESQQQARGHLGISQRTVDLFVNQSTASGRPETPELRKSIIDQLALQVLVAQEAVKKGLEKSPEVAEQLEAVRQSVLANAYVQDFIKSNPVSDEALKAEYERIKANMSGTEYKARHILVEQEAEAKGMEIRSEAVLKQGSSEEPRQPDEFVELARRASRIRISEQTSPESRRELREMLAGYQLDDKTKAVRTCRYCASAGRYSPVTTDTAVKDAVEKGQQDVAAMSITGRRPELEA